MAGLFTQPLPSLGKNAATLPTLQLSARGTAAAATPMANAAVATVTQPTTITLAVVSEIGKIGQRNGAQHKAVAAASAAAAAAAATAENTAAAVRAFKGSLLRRGSNGVAKSRFKRRRALSESAQGTESKSISVNSKPATPAIATPTAAADGNGNGNGIDTASGSGSRRDVGDSTSPRKAVKYTVGWTPHTRRQQLTSSSALVPPQGYVCNICRTSGHFVQQCPMKQSSFESIGGGEEQYVTISLHPLRFLLTREH